MSWETDEAKMTFVSDGKPLNRNALEGFYCPKCSSEGPFNIRTICFAEWTDDGAADLDRPEMVKGGDAHCPKCGYYGVVEDFKTRGKHD